MKRFRGPFAALMCLSLLSTSPTLPAIAGPARNGQTSNPTAPRPAYHSSQIQADGRILHALNRFTFGPRPGDLDAVRAMGLEKWFNRQLHPETFDQVDLNARLAQFPAMRENPQQLLFRLPSNAVIRQAMDGKAPVPDGFVLHAIYENQIARVDFKRQEQDRKKLEQASQSSIAPNAGAAAMGGDAATKSAEPIQAGEMQRSEQEKAADPALIDKMLALGPQQRVAQLASMDQAEHDGFRKALKPQQRTALLAGLSPAQKEQVAALENPQRVVVEELASQRLTRDIYSNAQLQEVMTDFWLNHFNVFLHKNDETPYYLVSYERDVIRPRSLDKFEDLLEAVAHSPAMLLYLDNASSMGPDSPAADRAKAREAHAPGGKPKAREGLNENYARELMELHTLGVNGGYTQADVTQVARILTGWTVDKPQRGGAFKFDENRHEPGTKKVMGKKFKEHGEQEGRELLHMLATRPPTARFLCRKLAIRFVSDDPPQSLVDRMAKSYLSSGGDISAVLKTLFHSPEFWMTDIYQAKVKTPIEFVVSAGRATGASADNLQPLINALREMGMPLYGAVPPTGYNWEATTWISSGQLVNRMNFALSLAANKLPGIAVDWSATSPESSTQSPTEQTEELRLESRLIPCGMSESTRVALLEQVEKQPAQNAGPAKRVAAAKPDNPAQAATALEKQDQLLAGLLLGSPEFQRR